jgi:hypothetical protein
MSRENDTRLSIIKISAILKPPLETSLRMKWQEKVERLNSSCLRRCAYGRSGHLFLLPGFRDL